MLNRAPSDNPVYIAPEHILFCDSDSFGTKIVMSRDSIIVTQKPEEVVKMILHYRILKAGV